MQNKKANQKKNNPTKEPPTQRNEISLENNKIRENNE